MSEKEYFLRSLIFFLLASFSAFFTSCANEEKEDEGMHFYEGNYTDELAFKTSAGDLNIVVYQIILAPRLKENIPYSLNSSASDSTRLKLFVSYGNYNPGKPGIYQDISLKNDSVFIWYSNREKMLKKLHKANSINEPEDDMPKPAYIRIDSIAVSSASNVKLTTRTLR